ncbi:MAG: outer membrane protein transport protein [Deltaproteobacteria bacterium]|nr:outer membrane protein transport protein [Deltaproteobacteria bacterium]
MRGTCYIITLAVAALAPAAAHAGGFYVPEIGPRAVGRAGAMVADDSDPSLLFHNPAGLIGLAGQTAVQAAAGLVLPDVTFFRRPIDGAGPGGSTLRFDGVSNTNKAIVVPWLGAAIDLHRKDLALAVGVYAPFGATIEFPVDGAQRHVVTAIALRSIWIGPSLAWKGPGGLRLGASLAYVYSDLRLEQINAIPFVTGDPEVIPNPDPAVEGTTTIKGKDPFSVGATLGAQWVSPSGRLAIGASATLPVNLHLKGDGVIVNAGIAPLVDGSVMQPGGQRTDQLSVDLPLPLVVRAGVRLRPARGYTVLADVNWQRWSTFKTLTIDFAHQYELLPTPGADLYDVSVANAWKDTFTGRLGAELAPWAAPLTARVGVLYDQSPVDDRHFALTTPDSNKLGVSAGAAYRIDLGRDRALTLDLAFMHLFLAERDVTASDGTILNKPAPSFYAGVTRAAFNIAYLGATYQL